MSKEPSHNNNNSTRAEGENMLNINRLSLERYFLGSDADDAPLKEPLSPWVMLKRFLLVIDNILAAFFFIFFWIGIEYYFGEESLLGSINASWNFFQDPPILTVWAFSFLLVIFWRPLRYTKIMPLSHYVNDFVLFIWIVFLIMVTVFSFLTLGRFTSYDDLPYGVTFFRHTALLFLFVYRRIYLSVCEHRMSIRSLWSIVKNRETPNATTKECSVEAKSVHSTLRDDLKWLVLGPHIEGITPKPLSPSVVLRRFFIVLDNLIAPAACYYFFVWMKRFYYGIDCSFDAVISDIFYDQDYGTIFILYFLLLVLFWRWLWYSDSSPYWRNFTDFTNLIVTLVMIVFFCLFLWIPYSKLLELGHFHVATSFVRERGFFHFEHYVPFWIEAIRVFCVIFITYVRRCCMLNFDFSTRNKY